MNKTYSLSILCGALAVLFTAGCASTVTVTANEPGAMIRFRGHGRPSYRWQTPAGGLVRKAGDSCQFKTRYSTIDVYAIWDEGTEKAAKSDVVTIPLSNWSDPEPVTLVKKR